MDIPTAGGALLHGTHGNPESAVETHRLNPPSATSAQLYELGSETFFPLMGDLKTQVYIFSNTKTHLDIVLLLKHHPSNK